MRYKMQMKKKLIKCIKFTAAVVTVCFLLESQVLASPAVLDSMSAVIYEDMSEGSIPIGNLVQGNTFELLGSAMSEDGQGWYQISINGLQGYITADAVLIPTEQDVVNGEENAQAAEPDNHEQEALEEEENQADDNQEHEAEEELEEENEEMSVDEQTATTLGMQENKQKKTYGLAVSSEKIKKDIKENTEPDRKVGEASDSFVGKVDKTACAVLLVIAGSIGMIGFCIKEMKRLYAGLSGTTEAARKSWWESRKVRKKKKAKQNKKKQQLAKEAKRWKSNNIQK